jgi:alpha-beta hydrolase superfamily lysophospholipase
MKLRLPLTAGALFLFASANVLAFCHAWNFTHFSTEPKPRTDQPEELSRFDRLKVLLTGVENPKPTNELRPNFPYQTLDLASPNGRLEAWYSELPQAQGSVALFHGYTSNKAKLLTEAENFRQLGYSVLLVDFSGNGGSEGNQCTVGYREAFDVAAAFQFLQKQNPTAPVCLYGISMGAVAVLRAQSELGIKPAASIIECPYGSLLETTQIRFHSMGVPDFPLANLLVFWGGVQNGFWPFDVNCREYARRISAPTLLLYGLDDARVTRQETDEIFDALGGPKQRHYFAGVGHEPYHVLHPEAWRNTIDGFLGQYATASL